VYKNVRKKNGNEDIPNVPSSIWVVISKFEFKINRKVLITPFKRDSLSLSGKISSTGKAHQ
jgi:hypothetical protein